jgi:poly(beta-D-mannuronate) lyase
MNRQRPLALILPLLAACSHAPAPPAPALEGGVSAAGCLRVLPIAGPEALGAAAAAAQPGDCLVLADGQYQFPPLTRSGTAAHPITIRAAKRLKADVAGGSIVFQQAAFVVVSGLLFTSDGNIRFVDAQSCRLTRCRIQPREVKEVDWVDIEGTSHHIRVDHNDFGPKKVVGNMLMLGGNKPQVVQHNRIDHNYFHDISYGGGNGWETIRAGLSFLAPSSGFNLIEANLFRNTAGDPETISIKSSDNVIRHNTMRSNPGELVLRHGNRNQVYGNYILGEGEPRAGGMRICGADHRIYNNYIADVKKGAGIFLEGGDGDGTDVPGKQHYRVYRTQVVNNTLVGTGIQVGGAHPLAPVDCVVANNLVVGGTISEPAAVNTRYLGNIVSAGPTTRPAAEIRVADPGLIKAGQLLRVPAGSPAVDAAQGHFDFVTDDIDGQKRATADVGADELSAEKTRYAPLTEKDVGPDAP